MLRDFNTASVMYDLGIVLVALIALQALLFFYSSLRSVLYARAQQKLNLQALRTRVLAEVKQEQLTQEAAATTWSGFRKFRVRRISDEARDIKSFYLVPHDGKPFPRFQPGQYLTFSLKRREIEKPLIRCYSLSDSPFQNDHYRISIKRLDPPPDTANIEPGLSSNFFHREVAEDDIVDVKAPSGNFTLDLSRNKPVVLIGGGIGVTPMLSMLEGICETDSGRECWLFYGIRTSDEYIMRDRIKGLAAQNKNVHAEICISQPNTEDVEGRDYNYKGRVTLELLKSKLTSNNYEFYICGPGAMMEALTSGLKEWGVPDTDINFESFGPASIKKTSETSRQSKALSSQKRLEIEFSKSSKTIEWDGSCSSILELAETHNITIESGCRAGSCGTCLTALKQGEVEYIEEPGTLPESSSCLTCISIPKTKLILDA